MCKMWVQLNYKIDTTDPDVFSRSKFSIIVLTRVQAKYLNGRERAELADAEAHDVRDRSDGDRYGSVR